MAALELAPSLPTRSLTHSQDELLRPDAEKPENNKDSGATFALPQGDPARVENRRGLEAVLDGESRA